MFGFGGSEAEKLEKRANKGDRGAQLELGKLYFGGKGGVSKNIEEALKWFRAAEAQRDAVAPAYIGMAYEFGWGVPQSDSEAVRWYTISADRGFEGAMFDLGNMYEQGRGVPKDLIEAERLYRLSAKKGYEKAKAKLRNF